VKVLLLTHVMPGNSVAPPSEDTTQSYFRQVAAYANAPLCTSPHITAGDHVAHRLLASAVVAARVRQGGHDIPEEVVRRRFLTGWTNCQHVYQPVVDAWALYDNSEESPQLIAEGEKE
jgi:hypothetical protein